MPKEHTDSIRDIVRQELSALLQPDRLVFDRLVQILDGRNIMTGRGVGTIIGTAADQKLGFFGAAPVVQQVIHSGSALDTTVDALVALGLAVRVVP